MDGSAAVIGEMMLPILEPLDPAAAPHARDLGDAFQLTNFLRDVAEDLDRGRVYLPQEDLRRYDADPEPAAGHARSGPTLMRFEIGRCRRLYVSADIGIGMLPPQSARCVRTARVLYSRILDVIEEQGYDVFTPARPGADLAEGGPGGEAPAPRRREAKSSSSRPRSRWPAPPW